MVDFHKHNPLDKLQDTKHLVFICIPHVFTFLTIAAYIAQRSPPYIPHIIFPYSVFTRTLLVSFSDT